MLLTVAGRDAPDRILGVAVILQNLEDGGAPAQLLDTGVEGPCALIVDKLIQVKGCAQGPGDPIEAGASLLPGLHVLAMGLPEVFGQGHAAGVEQVRIINDLVVEVVLRGQSQRMGLDPNVNVLGDQHNLSVGVPFTECPHHRENLVVRLPLEQPRDRRGLQKLGLEEEPSGRIAVAQGIQRKALAQTIAPLGGKGFDQCIKASGHLPHMPRNLGETLLVAVELL